MAPLKVAVIVPDGAADEPMVELGGMTPLEYAVTSGMDRIASCGACGTVRTVPPGMAPGSDVANLSLMGYDPVKNYGGRGAIEAAFMEVSVPDGWYAFRCNLVTTDGTRMLDYSAGHIGQRLAEKAIDALQSELGDARTIFHPGKSYRHIALLEGDYAEVECVPPHDITGKLLDPNMPTGRGSKRLRGLMERSRDVLTGLRGDGVEADMIWLWGQGRGVRLEPFEARFGLRGAVISAVDLINGLGRLMGLQVVKVPGATGYLDTNYRGKGEAACRVLESLDFIYVHVEAPDEASHMGSVDEKVKAIERIDAMVAGPVLEFLEGLGEHRILVCPDHPTFISTRTHDGSPTPYAASGAGIPSSGGSCFSERVATGAGPHFDPGWSLMSFLTGNRPWPTS